MTALLAVSHGTSSAAGRAAVRGLVEAIAERLPGTEVVLAHVDVEQPDVPTALAALAPGPVVVVPLLLAAGYHVEVDLRSAIDPHPRAKLAPPLGPDPRLAAVLARRLAALEGADASHEPRHVATERGALSQPGRSHSNNAALGRPRPVARAQAPLQAGRSHSGVAAPGQRGTVIAAVATTTAMQTGRNAADGDDAAIVLAAAGSSREGANEDARTVARQLAEFIGRPVTTAFLAAASPRLPDAVATSRAAGRGAVVASYLLAPGYFHDLAARSVQRPEAADLAGTVRDVITPPLLLPGEPPASELVDIVLDRFAQAAGAGR